MIGGLVIANLMTLLPGRLAGRTPAAALLRAELSRRRRARDIVCISIHGLPVTATSTADSQREYPHAIVSAGSRFACRPARRIGGQV